MIFHVLTIFPEMFKGFLNESILKKAQGRGVIKIELHNIRDHTTDKHGKVDDTPYGGGAGMLFTPQPLFDAIEAVRRESPGAPVIFLSPGGRRLTQAMVERLHKKWGKKPGALILLCGHYEGIDQRVIDECVDLELSIGDFVLSGGEIAAMVVIDAVSRLVPGALGNEASHQEESFSKKLGRKREYPHYTKPADFRGLKVPDVLLSGDHAKIERWRRDHLR